MTVYEFLHSTSDTVGIIGVILLLISYFLLTTNRLGSTQLSYQLLNLAGALCILFSLLFNFNLASVILEITWITISLIGIYKILKTP